jgi:hypothetical protein
MSQQRVTPANRRLAAPDIKGGPPVTLLLALQAAASGIMAPTGWGKPRKPFSLPGQGKVAISWDSGAKKRMRAMRRGMSCR